MFRAGYASSPSNLSLHLVFVISSVAVVARSGGYPPSSYLNDIKLFQQNVLWVIQRSTVIICGLTPGDFMCLRDKNAKLSQATIKRADTVE
jgi:hypothetical protein